MHWGWLILLINYLFQVWQQNCVYSHNIESLIFADTYWCFTIYHVIPDVCIKIIRRIGKVVARENFFVAILFLR